MHSGRNWFGVVLALAACAAAACAGCAPWQVLALNSAATAADPPKEDAKEPKLVGDLAVAYGLGTITIHGVGLVTGLKGTGSDPKPSPYQQALLAEMQIRGVPNPSKILASGNTSLVLITAYLRPGIAKGDRFDIEVRTPAQSDTTSLRGGYLLPAGLREYETAKKDGSVHQSFELATAEGPLLVDPPLDGRPNQLRDCRARVLSGAVSHKARPLALVLKSEHKSGGAVQKIDELQARVGNAQRVEAAVNRRFWIADKGPKEGVAHAKTGEYIELKIHPRYKNNLERYIAVVRSIPIKETEAERMARLRVLETQLLEPMTAAKAALRLEAIGYAPAIAVLQKAIHASDAEVRFYAAEALAYLDDPQAAAPLAEAARDLPAFRVNALAALSAMDDESQAVEQLRALLDVPSAETRYGAFRALWTTSPNDPAIRGESLRRQFSYHRLDTQGPPMIHVTRSRRPEIVLFGRDQRLSPPLALEAGNRIMVTANKPDEVVVSRFGIDQPDRKRTVSTQVDEVIRAIVELGGTYPDVVQALQQASASRALAGRFEVDALPQVGRDFDRSEKQPARSAGPRAPTSRSPTPDLYTDATPKPSAAQPTGENPKPEKPEGAAVARDLPK